MIGLLVIGIIVIAIALYTLQTNKGTEYDPKARLAGRIGAL